MNIVADPDLASNGVADSERLPLIKVTSAADMLSSWLADVESGKPPVRFKLNSPFDGFDVRPGRMILFGGAPGSGKTAALLQMGIDLLRLNDSARLLIACVEMSPTLLFDRIISQISAVPITAIENRTMSPKEQERFRVAVETLRSIANRLNFLDPPYSLEHVAAARKAFDVNVLILDYIQRFAVGDGSQSQRDKLETGMTDLRRFCDSGAVVMVAAAVARQSGKSGSNYLGLNLASFRGSSELEYACDSAFMLEPDKSDRIAFKGVKNRFGSVETMKISFDKPCLTFDLTTNEKE